MTMAIYPFDLAVNLSEYWGARQKGKTQVPSSRTSISWGVSWGIALLVGVAIAIFYLDRQVLAWAIKAALDHGYRYLTIAPSLRLLAFALICVAVPRLQLLSFETSAPSRA
jgi:hypothetical protein